MSNKENNIKEQFKQVLISTARVISDDYKIDIKKIDKNSNLKKKNFFDITNLSSKSDFIRLRAETDSVALSKKFSNKYVYNKNLPKNPACKSLYEIAEKIRYEVLGGRMLRGIGKNLKENYNQKLISIRKDNIKNKEDVPITDAFELYMLKKFFNLNLNATSSKMLSFWEKDFNKSVEKHLDFLNENLENQNNYNLKFSEILQNMDVFNSNDEETNEDNDKDDKEQENKSENNNENSQLNEDEKNQSEQQAGFNDADFELSDQQIDEQLDDLDSVKQNSDNFSQRESLNSIDQEYKIFTSEFDEIAKAENLEDPKEIQKLRKNLDQQLISFKI